MRNFICGAIFFEVLPRKYIPVSHMVESRANPACPSQISLLGAQHQKAGHRIL